MCNDLRSLQSKYLMRVLVNSKFQLAAGSVTLKLISWLTVLNQNLKSLSSHFYICFFSHELEIWHKHKEYQSKEIELLRFSN